MTNPKYKGYFVGGKVKVIDIFNKRQKFLPEDEWLMYKDEDGTTVPSLVSEELWQAANEVFKRRSIDVKGRLNC
ncbi:recombinase family protein, partial [Flavonifractor plautii]|uniref:recombinase family protein n=1 Tax=Flavonifractor plautii TaxID=292800 RepID=UPI00210EDD24|nr:recombinase family protein [Flavonifractor plautii]